MKSHCKQLRSELREFGRQIVLRKHEAAGLLPEPGVDKGEVLANLTLAFRHVEDAIMRLGKTIQALDGGVSCYDDTAKRPATSQEITDRCSATEQKVAACKEQASEQRPFHAVPAKDCCRAPVGEQHDVTCNHSKSYSP